MFRFAHPYFFGLLLPLAAAAWLVYRRRVATGILFAPTHRIQRSHTWRGVAATILPTLVLAGLLLCITALARPQKVFATTRDRSDSIAVEMVVDVSGSMEALDMSIRTATGVTLRTRLEAVKQTFAEFIEQRPDDLVGLVTFGGYATTRSPLTLDHRALLHVLKGVEIPKQSFDRQGQIMNREELLTAIGDALATACARLENAEPTSRIIVLLSDGESNTGLIEPAEAIRVATKMGVKIYTIGVGSSGMAPFRGRNAFGKEQIFQAQVVLDEELLRRIAQQTGGRYFNVRDPRGLDKAMREIDELEKTTIERQTYSQYDEFFPRLLWPGLILVSLGVGLNMAIAGRFT
ncbi:MAG: VWA domain-containing protein [Lentisphaerae bacterium]|nr:VWA domain-containing protein [Lentisphaerota bacterium]